MTDVRCCFIDGNTCQPQHFEGGVEFETPNGGTHHGCYFGVTYLEATTVCHEAGMRVCDNDEVLASVFAKTLPGGASFLQEQVHPARQGMSNNALVLLSAARNSKLDFIVLAVSGKKADFEKVMKPIDHLTVDDESSKEHWEAVFDQAVLT